MRESIGDMVVEKRLHRFTVDEFERMGAANILPDDRRFELVDGVLIDVPPQGLPHSSAVGALNNLLASAFGARAYIWPQLPLLVSDRSLPEPDIVLLRADARGYRDRRPAPPDAFAVIEVADASLTFDRREKLLDYARNGVVEYWIVSIEECVVEVYREPHALGYGSKVIHRRGEWVAFAAFPDDAVAVSEIFG